MTGIGIISHQEAVGDNKWRCEGWNIPYDQFVSDLRVGEEIEFIYKKERYSISNNGYKWFFNLYGDLNYQTFASVDELLKEVKINSKSLEELWSNISLD